MYIRRKVFIVFLATTAANLFSQGIRLGLNFPFRGPEYASIANHISRLEGCGAHIYRQMTYADLIWKHVEPTDNNWNFKYPDSVFFHYLNHEYVANLYALTVANTNNGNVGYQVPWRACTNSPLCGWRYNLDSTATMDYLSTCVNRYSSKVRYWELGNESINSNYPLGMPILPFVDFVKHNYRWIKAVNPQVKVLLPGTVGTYGFPMQKTYQDLHALFSNNIGNYFDIFSFHDYNAWWTTPLHIDSILAIRDLYGLQDKEVWITESSVSSLNFSAITPTYSSVDEQAADVWRRSTIAWAKGIHTFFWHSGWSSPPPNEWAEFGLLDHTGKKKKSYHSYRLLADKIANFTSAQIKSMGIVEDNNNSTIGGNGVWVMKFVVNGESRYVMWSRDAQTYSLTSASDVKYIVTSVVPSDISNDGETAVFSKDSIYLSAGAQYTFRLSSLPILVEEVKTTSISIPTERTLIEVFPNPAKSYLEIKSALSVSSRIELLDALGRLVLQTELKPQESEMLYLNKLNKGIYFYSISREGIILQQGKIVIE